MPTWLRSIFGIALGGANLFANGTGWRQILVTMGMAGLGIITHLSSTSDASTTSGKAAPHRVG